MNNKMLKLNGQMYKLGTQNFSDNATVKVVTMVTLTYLPASFIAVSHLSRSLLPNRYQQERVIFETTVSRIETEEIYTDTSTNTTELPWDEPVLIRRYSAW